MGNITVLKLHFVGGLPRQIHHTNHPPYGHTPYILPPCVQDYLPEDHLARFVVEIVDQLDLCGLSAVYAGKGKRPYHPAMLLALLFYGYATGIFSSRKLEKATVDSMVFKYICANENPDHDTINSFRQRFSQEIEALFVEIPSKKGSGYITNKKSNLTPFLASSLCRISPRSSD